MNPKDERAPAGAEPLAFFLGDSPDRVSELNSLHDPKAGAVVVHLAPRGGRERLDVAVLQAMGHTNETSGWSQLGAETRKTLRHWVKALGVRHVFFYPAEELDRKSLTQLSGFESVQIWLPTRRNGQLAAQKARFGAGPGSFRTAKKRLKQDHLKAKENREIYSLINNRAADWPEDPWTARTNVLSSGDAITYANFDSRWQDAFFATQHELENMPRWEPQIPRWIRMVAADRDGQISPGAYCGIWAAFAAKGIELSNPPIEVVGSPLRSPDLSGFEKASCIDEALVYGLSKAGLCLVEIAHLRAQQVSCRGGVRICGIEVAGSLADVIETAYNRTIDPMRPFAWHTRLVGELWPDGGHMYERFKQMYRYYCMGYARFQEGKITGLMIKPGKTLESSDEAPMPWVHPAEIKPDSRPQKPLAELVPNLPAAYLTNPLRRDEVQTIQRILRQTPTPKKMTAQAIDERDDISTLIERHYVEIKGGTSRVRSSVRHSLGYPVSGDIDVLHTSMWNTARSENGEMIVIQQPPDVPLEMIAPRTRAALAGETVQPLSYSWSKREWNEVAG